MKSYQTLSRKESREGAQDQVVPVCGDKLCWHDHPLGPGLQYMDYKRSSRSENQV